MLRSFVVLWQGAEGYISLERTPYNQGKKESGWDLAPGKELWKSKLFLRPGKPLHWP